MRLVVVTQVVDADHPALAQTIDALHALAARCEHVTVLCDRVARHDLPASVTFRTFGARTRPARGGRFLAALRDELSRRPDAVFVHMVPLFLVLAAPLARRRRVPLVLWYTHWHASRTLRLATKLADVVLSVDQRSFPIASSKVEAIGHAIDVARFAPRQETREGSPRLCLLALGRTARWKGYETLLGGFTRLLDRGVDAELEIRGPSLTRDEQLHREELTRIVDSETRLRTRVRLEPPLPRDQLPEILARADALVSPAQPESSQTLDKVVYEAAACGLPVLASNPALDAFLGGLPLRLQFRSRDSEDLANALYDLASATPDVRAEVGLELRRRVEASHSLESWADAVVRIVDTRKGTRYRTT